MWALGDGSFYQHPHATSHPQGVGFTLVGSLLLTHLALRHQGLTCAPVCSVRGQVLQVPSGSCICPRRYSSRV